ncbi:MAG TPA: phenylalanine--tRNA ligase subunit beta [Candidatus Bathyarchaeia archaeon]|nr:phenylalanine--tRNA ligase subunit beta [Candidatus Bathyarchaeia archaeon]
MPVITLQRERFSKFVGRDVTVEKMTEWLPWVGFDLEDVGSEYVKVEFNPNRIDLCSYAGVARAFKGLMGWETGLPKYKILDGKIKLTVSKAVGKVRPYMLAAVVRNIRLDEEAVVDLMEMQEDLHWGIGRNRKKASIGVHNLDVVNPPFKYTAVKPDKAKFVPLDHREEMALRDILEKHEKGMAYKHLVDWAPKYPLLIDKEGKVLSMPPVINGELTRVTNKTTNLFLDVTGTDYAAVERSLNILATALSDMGGTLEKVHVKCPDRTIVSPSLAPQRMKLRVDYANQLLGLALSEAEVIESLRKCRLDARVAGKGVVEVAVPAYRIDVLHEVDLVEEVAIGYGYYRLKPTIPERLTIGEQHPVHRTAGIVRQIMIGLGFTEVMNFTLTNEVVHYEKMRLEAGNVIKLANPVSLECTILRQSLLPNLMKNLMDNKHESFPQRLFEVSDVGQINQRAETRVERRLHIAGVSSHSTANFTEIKSTVEALLHNMGVKRWEIKPTNHPSFIEGRTAIIQLKRRAMGILGEIHPAVLNNFELEKPTNAFEIDLEALF